MRPENAWSILSKIPIIYYDEKYDAELCFWNGVHMTKAYALLICAVYWMNVYPSSGQEFYAYKELERLYLAGAFENVELVNDIIYTESESDGKSSTFYFVSYINDKDENFISDLRKKYTAKEILNWFLIDEKTYN